MQPSNGLVKPILRFSDVQSFFGKLGDDFRIQCPAHDGEDENLSIKRAEDGGILAKCRSRGCPFKDILAGLCARMGVKMRPAKLPPASELSWNYPAPSWLWLPYLPIGGVSLLVGDQSTGKTAFAAWVAARVTKGEAFPNMARFPVPDEVPPAAFVGWFDSGENGGRISARRFDAAGVDGDRLFFIEGMHSMKDVDSIRVLIESLPERPKLVVFDNLLVFSSGMKLIDPGEIGSVIANLNRLATELDLAILVVHHDGKGNGAKALQNIARSVLLVGRHPDHERVCVVAHTKCVEEAEGKQMAYNLAREEIPSGGTAVKCVPVGEL